jgi:hypothetical protein
MPVISWPLVTLLAAILASVTALGLGHVLPAEWIEHTLAAVVGVGVGHVLSRWVPPGRERE